MTSNCTHRPLIPSSLGCFILMLLLSSLLFVDANIGNANLQNIISLIPSYQLQIQESLFKPFTFNVSSLVAAAIVGNFIFVFLMFYVLAFLPENRIGSSKRNGNTFYGDYEEDYYDGDYFYDERRRRLQKRSDILPLLDLSFPASQEEMESRSSKATRIKNGLSHFFTYPAERISNAFQDLYQIYENYWRGVVGSSKLQSRKIKLKQEDAFLRKSASHYQKHKKVPPGKGKRNYHRLRHSY
uniref:Uncharacterized protein n=1 Tax=Lepeophtheirus salmonis TaxID=72036 RepID=A0A0K2UH67_LEPSM